MKPTGVSPDKMFKMATDTYNGVVNVRIAAVDYGKPLNFSSSYELFWQHPGFMADLHAYSTSPIVTRASENTDDSSEVDVDSEGVPVPILKRPIGLRKSKE